MLSPELFALHIAVFLLEKYGHLSRAYVDVERLRWTRIVVGEEGHKHAFQRDGEEKQVARVELEKAAAGLAAKVTGGLVDLLGAHGRGHVCGRD